MISISLCMALSGLFPITSWQASQAGAGVAAAVLDSPLPTDPSSAARFEVPQAVSLTPPELFAVLGPLVSRNSTTFGARLATYDQRYIQTEKARFADWLKIEDDRRGAYLLGSHYGGLRSRLMWAIRSREPFGPSVTDESRYGYARGVRTVRRFLTYSAVNHWAVQTHNNTSLADVELLYRLEGDSAALMHIHCTAAMMSRDPYGYIKLRHPNTAPRQPAIALEALSAAHRLKVPYSGCPENGNFGIDPAVDSWEEAGERIIGWVDDYITSQDSVYGLGGVPASAHGGQEAYFMNAMLAVQLMKWHAFVKPNPRAMELAGLVMDHLIAVLAAKPGWPTLGYETRSAQPAPDLAGYYIWPALVLWQERNEPPYLDFAMKNLAGTNRSYIDGIKQWNQVYSTLGQGTEAMLAGIRWH